MEECNALMNTLHHLILATFNMDDYLHMIYLLILLM